jgi:hypothetical protein
MKVAANWMIRENSYDCKSLSKETCPLLALSSNLHGWCLPWQFLTKKKIAFIKKITDSSLWPNYFCS